MPSIKHAQSPIYMQRFKACYIVRIIPFHFYHWESYVIPSKRSIIQTAQHNWLCAEMTRSELSYFCRCCSPVAQPAEGSWGKGRDYIITLPAPQPSQPQS